MKRIVVAGIGTGVGKTFIAAILIEALRADYWKPVQAGNLDFTDTDTVRALVSNPDSFFHPEKFRLSQPMSPHAAAKIDGVEIDSNELELPLTKNHLIIETAGGLMVPLNLKELNIDLIKKWQSPVVLVSMNYLGSINHTLLSVAVLRDYGIAIPGLFFNGQPNPATEDFILGYTGLTCLGRIGLEDQIDKNVVKKYAESVRNNINF